MPVYRVDSLLWYISAIMLKSLGLLAITVLLQVAPLQPQAPAQSGNHASNAKTQQQPETPPPFVVKADNQVTSDESNKKDSIATQDTDKWVKRGFGINVILTLITLVIAGATWLQANAAKDAADISRLSMVNGDRAFVSATKFRWLSHLYPQQDRYYWRIHFLWSNSGKTPTRRLRVRAEYVIRDSRLSEDFLFPLHSESLDPQPLISPNGVIGCTAAEISGDDLAAVQDGKKHLYIYGVARYFDVFPGTEEHVTKFCNFAANITGNPRRPYDAQSNPVGIDFAHYHQHNCADDECV